MEKLNLSETMEYGRYVEKVDDMACKIAINLLRLGIIELDKVGQERSILVRAEYPDLQVILALSNKKALESGRTLLEVCKGKHIVLTAAFNPARN